MKFLFGDFVVTESCDYCSISKYVGSDLVVTIPEMIHGKKVKVLGATAFQGMATLQSVYLPDCVEVIDHHAFSGCKELASIHMGNGVRILGANCFEECVHLCNIQLSSSLRLIFDSAFEGCISLRQIYVHPESVIALAPNVFRDCSVFMLSRKIVSRADVSALPSVSLSDNTGDSVMTAGMNAIQLGGCYAQHRCSVASFICAGLLMTKENEICIFEMDESEWELKVYD